MNESDIHLHAPMGATPEELAAYLDKACGGAAALRARVEALFAKEVKTVASVPATMPAAAIPAAAQRTELLPGSAAEQPADVIGNYKLLQQIGEGGFGVVYMADQLAPVKRRVALKIIKLGMDTRQVVARFEAERQALALMDHPNIAQVFDAGSTENGRPYFVMELVKGIPITRFCDEQRLGTRERLALFADVCSAINHAHQKGVIHRDIKPSNVMVTLHGEKPVPKVIDFGIAKATQSPLTDKTLFTRFEQFIGTPAYMSPEQAALSGLDIDTRSDIYALGVLLYELLTGRPPFDPQTLISAGYDEMRRIIREVEPPKPSARLSTVVDAERTTIAHAVQLRENAARVSHEFLGAENPDALGAKARLASSYEKAARLDEAARVREELLPVLEKVRGLSHSDTTAVRFALLKQYERANDEAKKAGTKPAYLVDVIRLRRGMLDASTEKHGVESLATLHVRHNLAHEMWAAGKPEEGLRWSRETLAIARRLPPSPDNAFFLRFALWCLAWHCGESGLKDEANRLNAELLALHPRLGAVRSVLIPENAEWKWHHPRDGVDPEKTKPGFHADFPRVEFDDSQWAIAAMQDDGFGYGKEFKGVDIGTPPAGKRRAAWFRCHFKTTSPLNKLELRARRDDGLIIYLDGQRIIHDNLPPDAPDAWSLDALQGVNDAEVDVTMAWPVPGELPAGDHVLAVSLHNCGNDSSDLRLGHVTLVELEPESN